MTNRIGGPDQTLDEQTVRDFVSRQLAALDLEGRSLCVVIPDRTRQCPLPLLLDAIADATTGRVASCTAVVALGTHGPLSDEALLLLAGSDRIPVVNHAWWDDATFADVGSLDPDLVRQLSGGRLHEAVDVRINRLVIDSDVNLIVGPVLPHEVAGFSGGYKYFFPGLSGQDLIDVTHWLGALISSAEIIGTTGITPVRALIHAAAALVPGEHHALSLVVDDRSGDLEAMAFGDPVSSWAAAVEVAAESHIVHLPDPVERVLSLVPSRYDDLWTGAKGFYKVEPVVADGGEVVIYAPHITEISAMHPDLDRLGYHCRDFFLAQWDRFRDCPRGELAHSTHLYGAGTYDPVDGERQRVRVTLATGIPRETVEAVNLNYLDPATVDVAAWRDDPTALVVPDAGEVLFRLRYHHDEGSVGRDS
jgi:nickel-dependent lactate racemase